MNPYPLAAALLIALLVVSASAQDSESGALPLAGKLQQALELGARVSTNDREPASPGDRSLFLSSAFRITPVFQEGTLSKDEIFQVNSALNILNASKIVWIASHPLVSCIPLRIENVNLRPSKNPLTSLIKRCDEASQEFRIECLLEQQQFWSAVATALPDVGLEHRTSDELWQIQKALGLINSKKVFFAMGYLDSSLFQLQLNGFPYAELGYPKCSTSNLSESGLGKQGGGPRGRGHGENRH